MSAVIESSKAETGKAESAKPETEKLAPAINVTPKAVQKIRQTFAKMGVQGGLRLGVLGGGCTGLSYQFKFDTKPRPNDNVFDYDGVQVFIDPKSILYLKGLTLDYQETLMQSGFVFDNPNATKKCGCGTSFAA